jgi:hypothetical protein
VETSWKKVRAETIKNCFLHAKIFAEIKKTDLVDIQDHNIEIGILSVIQPYFNNENDMIEYIYADASVNIAGESEECQENVEIECDGLSGNTDGLNKMVGIEEAYKCMKIIKEYYNSRLNKEGIREHLDELDDYLETIYIQNSKKQKKINGLHKY